MALPYEVKILDEGWDYEWDDELSTVERVVGIDEKFIYTKVIDTHNGEEYRDDKWPIDTFDAKPYLRPMSSMNMDECCELEHVEEAYDNHYDSIMAQINWLLEHHFDFMGLIPKNLAIEVTENNNPYKD